MTTQTITWLSPTKICFTGMLPVDVILCVPSQMVAPHICPESGDNQTTEFSYIEATLTAVQCCSNVCGQQSFQYTFEYDDAQIADGVTFSSTYITGVFVRNCFTSWIEQLAGDEVYIQTEEDYSQSLISQHGCVYPLTSSGSSFCLEVEDTDTVDLSLIQNDDGCYSLSADVIGTTCLQVQDSATVDLTLTEVDNCNLLTAAVEISADVENCIEARADGLYVPCADAGFITSVSDTPTVDLTVAVGTLSADVEVSAGADNLITVEADGIKVDNCADYQNECVIPTTSVVSAVQTIVGDITNPSVDTNQYIFEGNLLTITNDSICRSMCARWEMQCVFAYSLTIPVTELVPILFDYRFELAVQLSIDGGAYSSFIVLPEWLEQGYYGPNTDYILHKKVPYTASNVLTVGAAASRTVRARLVFSAISMSDNRALMTVTTESYIQGLALGTAI